MVATSRQPGSEQSGNNRQQQAEQPHVSNPGTNVSPGKDSTPSRSGNQELQRRGSGFFHDPFSMFQQMSHHMDEMFDSFFRGNARRSAQGDVPTLWAPDIDIRAEGK